MENSKLQEFRVKGLVAATFTPMKKNLEVDYERIAPYAEFLLDQGVKSVFVNGTTGEGANLTTTERKLIAQKWMEVASGKMDNIMVHVGGSNLTESIELAAHADKIGAHAIGLVAPTYFKPQTEESLLEYCRLVAEAAPKTPFYYYHIPSFTGVDFIMTEFMNGMIKNVPTFRGIKFSHTDYMDLHQCFLKENAKYNILFGCDQQLLCAMVLGVDAAIGSTYNYMGRTYNRMIEAYAKGDLAMARQQLNKAQLLVIEALKSSCNISAFKTIMKISGFDVGPVRPALTNIGSEEAEELVDKLNKMGFKDWRA